MKGESASPALSFINFCMYYTPFDCIFGYVDILLELYKHDVSWLAHIARILIFNC